MTSGMDGDQSLVRLSASDAQEVENVVDAVFSAEESERLEVLRERADQVTTEEEKALLAGLEKFLAAVMVVRESNDMVRSQRLSAEAAEILKRFLGTGVREVEELTDLAVGWSLFAQANIEVQSLNIGKADELFVEARQRLERAGEFASGYQALVDKVEAAGLFFSGMQALFILDYVKGETLFARAVERTTRLAKRYCEPDSMEAHVQLGTAKLYAAIATFTRLTRRFNVFAFREVGAMKSATRDAEEAVALLEKAEAAGAAVSECLCLAKTFVDLNGAIVGVAGLMLRALTSTFKADLGRQIELKGQLDRAAGSAAACGPGAVSIVRHCEGLKTQVENLYKLAKPTRTDFGIFSGLVSCAMFLPLFVATSWANSKFGAGLEAPGLVGISSSLALVAGFGYGALKYVVSPSRLAFFRRLLAAIGSAATKLGQGAGDRRE